MSQLPLFEQLTWSVTRLTRYLRDLLESDSHLQNCGCREKFPISRGQARGICISP